MRFLTDDKRQAPVTRWFGESLADLAERFAVSTLLRRLESVPGSRVRRADIEGLRHEISPIPQNALSAIVREWEPDVVVGNSLIRFTWRRIREHCSAHRIATVLYVREVASLGHLDITPNPAEVVVANARSLADAARELGHDCAFVPSVIDTERTRTASTRKDVLLVNPIATHGIDLLWDVAARLPEIPFVIQESWELDPSQLASITAQRASHPNVTLRRRRPPGPELFSSARLLLVPHRIDNRPRVIAEAQANGIPAVVSDMPGLIEAVGAGGLVRTVDDAPAWADTVRSLWNDEAAYSALRTEALAESQRSELDPSRVVGEVEALLETARVRVGSEH